MSEKKTEPVYMDPARVKEILELQSVAAKKDIPLMVFLDRDHMAEARSNMELGAMIKAEFFYFVPDRHYIH